MSLPTASTPRDPDAAIRLTDTDAAQARLSAVRKSYLIDPFIQHLVQRPHLVPTRPPLINIGTYIRSEAIDALVTRWFALFGESEQIQIVSLGAGSDTRCWRLLSGSLGQRLSKYVEIDFPEVTGRKLAAIRKAKDLHNVLGEVIGEHGGTGCRSEKYHLIPADLRTDPDLSLGSLISILNIEHPTLVIAECVFAYMETTASNKILDWLTSRFSNIGCLIYEMFGLNDSFGQVMRENLRVRNVILPGVEECSNLNSLQQRFLEHGFSEAKAMSLRTIRASYITGSEHNRMQQLEAVDEWEEILLVLDHYAVSWGSQISEKGVLTVGKEWGLL